MITKFKVSWIPQIPGEAFVVEDVSLPEAVRLMNILADYDQFQYDQCIKPDYANVGWISGFDTEDNEWYDLEDFEIEDLLVEPERFDAS